jgi:predicted molibdopterin-dependent oxidoreductase YjgC
MAQKLSTCTFCGVGCGLYLETAHNRILGAYPSMSHPSNEGRICVRGWNVHEVASSPNRLRFPLIREDGRLREVGWDDAFAYLAGRLREIRERYGPDSMAFLNSPRCSNEESFLLQKFARSIIGTNNVDHGTGVYCNNSIHVLMDMLGVPATTNSLGELDSSRFLVVDGVDLGKQLPTIGGRVLRAKLNGATLAVIDSRRHRLVESADLFLQLKPGTDIWLYGAMAKVIVDRGLLNWGFIKAHCRDWAAFLSEVQHFDLLQAADVCGVPPGLIEQAAIGYAQAPSAALLFSTGIEARGKDSIRSIVNLALLTGQLGRPGAGLYALTEQNNLQGVCDMGMLPDRFPGYPPVTDTEFRSRLERQWKCQLPAQPGLGAKGILADGGQGRIKALWLCRYDPVSTAFFGQAAETLRHLDLVVVQHLFMTGTAEQAHVVLPVPAYGEERVTFTSTDRRIQLAERVIDPPAGPMPAWQQLTRLAHFLGADWNYSDAGQVMDEVGAVVPFYSGASYENLSREYGRQWPCTKDKPLGSRYLFEDGLPDKGFHFSSVKRPASGSSPSAEFPLTLVFGHSLYYWHQNVLIKHSETLRREYRILLLDYPNGFVEVNTDDAKGLGIRDGQPVRLRTAVGSAKTTARVTDEVRQGTIFVPFFVREVEQQVAGREGADSDPVYACLEKT